MEEFQGPIQNEKPNTSASQVSPLSLRLSGSQHRLYSAESGECEREKRFDLRLRQRLCPR